ncbi:MAG: hypothetical protein EBX40_02995 [Gammaproteobacteria bacterium]|nr:hypothetical protein [Gammaproteobacteria bacterium]
MIKTLVSALFAVGISASVAYATPLFPNQGNIVMGYYSDWSVYNTEHPDFYPGSTGGSQDPAKIQILKDKLKEVNSVAYAFLEMDPSGSVRFPDPWGDLSPSDMGFCADNAVICSGKTGQWDLGYGLFDAFANDSSITNKIISIGGYGHQQDWNYALSNPDAFVNSLIIIFKQYPHLNGIDIDAEPLSWVNEGPGPQKMIALLKELRTKLDSNGLSHVVISFPIAANLACLLMRVL